MTSATTHSPIGASSMYRWSVCPASVNLSKGIETSTSSYAAEGTEAHDWLAKLLQGACSSREIPEELRDSVIYAFDVIRTLIVKAGKNASYYVEHGFDLSNVYPGAFGTADFVLYSPKTKMLTVIDYKHGQGILVEVEGNSQLQYYGLGALTTLDGVGEIETVRLMVIQPRCPHPSGQVVRHWDIDSVELFDFAVDLQRYAKATEDPHAPMVPGEHCRFCPAAAVCPELSKKANEIAKSTFTEISDGKIPVPKTKEEIAKALKWLPTLKAWIESVNSYAYNEAMAGRPVPGYKLVEKVARRKWESDDKIIEFLEENGFSEEQIYAPKTVRSPNNLEKTLKLTKAEKQQLEPFILKKSSGLALVEEGDRRPAVNPADEAKKVFGGEGEQKYKELLPEAKKIDTTRTPA